jgi:hypothetical protein
MKLVHRLVGAGEFLVCNPGFAGARPNDFVADIRNPRSVVLHEAGEFLWIDLPHAVAPEVATFLLR